MRSLARHPRLARAALGAAPAFAAAILAMPASASAAGTGTIVYQCPDGMHICAVSPSGGTPTELAQTGTLAGVTRDGVTYGYAAASTSVPGHEGLFEAPVAGGAPTEVNANALGADLDPPRPVMSADGSAFLENIEQAGYFSTPDTEDIDEFSVSAGDSSHPTVVDSSTRFGMTYGWLGDSTLISHTAGTDLQPPSWVCIGDVPGNAQGFCASNDPRAKIQSATATISFPSGSPDGSQVVASVGAPGQAGGSIALFNASTGAMTATVASPPAGSLYAAPQFSPDGSEIVFESDSMSGAAPTIEVVSAAGGQPTPLAEGVTPYWGSASSRGSAGGGSSQLPAAARVSLVAPAQTLRAVRQTRHLLTRCRLFGPGTCTVRATLSASLAAKLGLSRRGTGSRAVTLASGSRTLRRSGSVLITLRLNAATAHALSRAHRLSVTLSATSSRPAHRPLSTSRTVTLG